MKIKHILLTLISMACLPQAMAEPTYSWWDGEAGLEGSGTSWNVNASSTGTWTIGMNLNVDALLSFGQGGSRQQPTNGNYTNTGNPLFSIKGDGYHTAITDKVFGSDTVNHVAYTDRNMTVTMGWGGNWYTNVENMGLAGNGVKEGLQMGVTSTKDPYNLSGGGIASNGFNVYVADMKQQNDGVQDADGNYDWSIVDEGKATVATLDDIARMTRIDQATLFVEHTYAGGPGTQSANNTDRDYASDSGDYKKDVTYTTFYITVTGVLDGKEVTINFMAQNDDSSSVSSALEWMGRNEGDMLGGSCWYDVDFIEQITGINGEFVDSMVFIDSAVDSATRNQIMTSQLPEPTTATLSILGLAALAARRRRRK